MRPQFTTRYQEHRLLFRNIEAQKPVDIREKAELLKGGDKLQELKRQTDDLKNRLTEAGKNLKDPDLAKLTEKIQVQMDALIKKQGEAKGKIEKAVTDKINEVYDTIAAAEAKVFDAEKKIKNPLNFVNEGRDANNWQIYTFDLPATSLQTRGPLVGFNGTMAMETRSACDGRVLNRFDMGTSMAYQHCFSPGQTKYGENGNTMWAMREVRGDRCYYRVCLHPAFKGNVGVLSNDTKVESESFEQPKQKKSVTIGKEDVVKEVREELKEKESDAVKKFKEQATMLKAATERAEILYNTNVIEKRQPFAIGARIEFTRDFIGAAGKEAEHLKTASATFGDYDFDNQKYNAMFRRATWLETELSKAKNVLVGLEKEQVDREQAFVKETEKHRKNTEWHETRYTNTAKQTAIYMNVRQDETRGFIDALEAEQKFLAATDQSDPRVSSRRDSVQRKLTEARQYLEGLQKEEKEAQTREREKQESFSKRAKELKDASVFAESQYELVTGFAGPSNISRPEATKKFITALEVEEKHLKTADAKDADSTKRLSDVQKKLADAREYFDGLEKKEEPLKLPTKAELGKPFSFEVPADAKTVGVKVLDGSRPQVIAGSTTEIDSLGTKIVRKGNAVTVTLSEPNKAGKYDVVINDQTKGTVELVTEQPLKLPEYIESGKSFSFDVPAETRLVGIKVLDGSRPQVIAGSTTEIDSLGTKIVRKGNAVTVTLSEPNKPGSYEVVLDEQTKGKVTLKAAEKKEERLKLPAQVEFGKSFTFDVPKDTKIVGMRVADNSIEQVVPPSTEIDGMYSKIVRKGDSVTVTFQGEKNKAGKYDVVLDGVAKGSVELKMPEKKKANRPKKTEIVTDLPRDGAKYKIGETVKMSVGERATILVDRGNARTTLELGKSSSREGLPAWGEMPLIERKSTAKGVSNIEMKIGSSVLPGEYELIVLDNGAEKKVKFTVKAKE